jgi:hypothetical protein
MTISTWYFTAADGSQILTAPVFGTNGRTARLANG